MSIDVMSAVWKHSEAKGSGLLTLLAIADNADDDGFAFPSYPHLASKTRLSKRQVQNVVSGLLDTDELTLISRGTQGRANEYSVNVAKLNAKPRQMDKQGVEKIATQEATQEETTLPPQPSASQSSEDIVANATDGQLFEAPPASKPDPLGDAVREVWEHHVGLFEISRSDLTDSRAKDIRRGFKEVMAGRTEPTREDIEYLKRASDGLKVWRSKKPGSFQVSALYATYPGGKSLGDQIEFFVEQAESGGTSASPKVPSVMAGTISARKREVVDMLAYPDSPDHKQRGLAAVEWLKEHVGEEPIIENGQLGGWRPVERAA